MYFYPELIYILFIQSYCLLFLPEMYLFLFLKIASELIDYIYILYIIYLFDFISNHFIRIFLIFSVFDDQSVNQTYM